MSFLPRFFRRRVLLTRARELLSAGDPRGALAILSDPIFAGSSEAADLARAAELHLASLPVDGPSAAIRDLLAQMRARKQASKSDGDEGDSSSVRRAASPARSGERPRGSRLARLRLAVDDAGEYLVAIGDDFVLGHAAARRADLGFLADVEREHARLVLETDFRSGARWRLCAIGGARASVGSRGVDTDGEALQDGDTVTLGPNLTFRFRACDPASASAVLELHHGLECFGAPRVLLLAPGPDGRVRLGAAAARLVRVASLTADVSIEFVPPAGGNEPARVLVACAGGVERGQRPRGDGPTQGTLDLPPRTSERFTLGARAPDRAPFEIVLSDADDAQVRGS